MSDSPPALSRREWEVVQLIARGASNREIAGSLGIADGTAAVHVSTILRKLGLPSRVHVTQWATWRDQETEPVPDPVPVAS
jgi:DNA-binding NarL/FixJ family response regulator